LLDFVLISRSLKHYAKKFVELKDDENIQLGNGFIKKDLDNNSQRIVEIAKKILQNKINNNIRDNSDLVTNSMEIYLKDLEKSKEQLIKKFEENGIKSYDLTEIHEEIGKIKKYLD